MARGVKGSGVSLNWSPETPHKASGKYFSTLEGARAYRERNNLVRRAKRAGFGSSDEELARFKRSEEIRLADFDELKERERRERAERDRIRQENGLHPRATVAGRTAAIKARKQTRVYLSRANRDRMTDSERLDFVRGLYRQRHTMSQTDLLIRVGQAVGAM